MSPRSQEIKQSGLFGFLAQPDAPTKAGVVLLPTIFGVKRLRPRLRRDARPRRYCRRRLGSLRRLAADDRL